VVVIAHGQQRINTECCIISDTTGSTLVNVHAAPCSTTQEKPPLGTSSTEWSIRLIAPPACARHRQTLGCTGRLDPRRWRTNTQVTCEDCAGNTPEATAWKVGLHSREEEPDTLMAGGVPVAQGQFRTQNQ
jgi:hypothetical protein